MCRWLISQHVKRRSEVNSEIRSISTGSRSFVLAVKTEKASLIFKWFFEDFLMDIFEFLDSCTGDGGAPLSCFVVS
jgi:hypothetical protein